MTGRTRKSESKRENEGVNNTIWEPKQKRKRRKIKNHTSRSLTCIRTKHLHLHLCICMCAERSGESVSKEWALHEKEPRSYAENERVWVWIRLFFIMIFIQSAFRALFIHIRIGHTTLSFIHYVCSLPCFPSLASFSMCVLCEYTKYKSYRTGSISDPYFSMRCWGGDGGSNGDVGGGVGGYSSGPLCAYTYVLASANYCLLLLLLHALLITLLLFHHLSVFFTHLFVWMQTHSHTHTLASTFSSSVFITFSPSFSRSFSHSLVHTIARGPFKICNNMLNNWAYTLLYSTLYASIIILRLQHAAKQFLFDDEERQQSNIDIRTMKTNYSNRSCNDFLSVWF